MTTQNMLRGRQVVASLTNQSGGAIIAGDVIIVSAANDESFTTTTSAAYNSTRVGVALESIASAAAGRILLEGYAPLVNVSASATRGHYLLTHTVAKQATSQAGYAAGAFGQIIKAGTTPSAMIFPVAQVGSAGVTRSGSTTDGHIAVWNGSNADSIKDGGAAGGAPTTAKYVTTAADAGLSAEVVIPGLAGSPDIAPAGVNDDEFDALSGWTTLGTLDTLNVTDVKSHVHMKRVNIAVHGDGIIKAIPSTPFTVTVKLTDAALDINYNSAGIILGEASPGKFLTFGPIFNSGWPGGAINFWTDVATLGSATNIAWANDITWNYLRIVVANTTSAEYWVSRGGLVWSKVGNAANPGFTIGTVGVGMSDSSAATTNEAFFDWIRFT